jgi:putative serine protease PepD
MARITLFVVVVVALCVAGVALGVVASNGGGSTIATSTVALEQPKLAPSASSGQGLVINEIYRQAAPSVVDIKVTSKIRLGGLLGGTAETEDEGAGVVYNTRGDILTDEHVVADAASIEVTFEDGSQTGAKVIGTDPSTDVAVVRVKAPMSELHPIAFADSSSAEVGDPVVVIGSPFGLPETVTSGIVSAVGRSITAPNNFTIPGAIQTDAPINPGNSGGPVLDGNGQVLGLADQIETSSTGPNGQGSSSGVGFATPSNTVVRIADKIVAGEPVMHAYVGVVLNDNSTGGAQITSVAPNSPASSAGLHSGDVLTAINGRTISSSEQFIEQIGTHNPGQAITLTIKRGGGTVREKLTLGTRPQTPASSPG